MTRVADAILTGQAQSFGRGSAMSDPQYGGSYGVAPDLSQWASMTHYTRPNLIVMLFDVPRGLQYLPDSDYYVSGLRAMVETHARNWDGFKSDLKVEFTETPVGRAGEQFQDVVNVTRERTTPTLTLVDLAGRPFQNLLQDYITYLIGDPDTGYPMINAIDGVSLGDYLNDMASMVILAFEPDPTFKRVAKAWLCANVMPDTTGPIEGRKDPTASRDTLEISLNFSAVTQSGYGVLLLAQKYFDLMNKTNANPLLRRAFQEEMSPDVASNFGLGGVIDNINNLGADALAAT